MTNSVEQTRAKLEALLSESVEEARERAHTSFDKQLDTCGRHVVLFGAGNMGRQVLSRLRQDGIEPMAFADNSQGNWGNTIEGVTVLPPNEAAAKYGSCALFIVTIYNHDHYYPDTKQQLTKMGCVNITSVIPLRWKYHETFLPYYRDDLPYKVIEQKAEILAGFELWEDEASRWEYVAQVDWRLHGNFEVLSKLATEQAYFPENRLFNLSPEEAFVDVGAYDGDTLRNFLALRKNDFACALALEPDPLNYERLTAYVDTLPAKTRGKIKTMPVAAGAARGTLRFSSGLGTSSSLSEVGGLVVECCRLDDLLADCRTTYVKMDIEGAELDAIRGASGILRSSKPIVAACVYHVQNHLWRIPLELKSGNPDYSLFLRPYMVECWETVCYAVPAQRRL